MALLKKYLYMFVFGGLLVAGLVSWPSVTFAVPPTYEKDIASALEKDWSVLNREGVEKNKTLKQNIVELFYPTWNDGRGNRIFKVVRDITLWVMIIFIIWAGASLLMSKDPKETSKSLKSLLYILLWWVFIYIANWLFWSVLNFEWWPLTTWEWWWIGWVTDAFVWKNNSVMFRVLSAIKAAAFFLAIIMIVVTGFKVVSAWDWEKGKKLVKWVINVVVALLVIKMVDFIYYMAADSQSFVQNAADFIINVAKIFGYIYGVIIVIMVIVAWYLYITDGWSWSNFKKASNVLVNILLSALVLFAFLLILYQVFAEFQTWWDAVWWSVVESQSVTSSQGSTASVFQWDNGWWNMRNTNGNFWWSRADAAQQVNVNI